MSISIIEATSPLFAPYGKLLKGDFSSAVAYLEEKTPMPEKGNLYVRSDLAFLSLPLLKGLQEEVFGNAPMEAGYCNGYNSLLNCLEYHACPEVNIMANDLVLLLALPQDIVEGKIATSKVKAFLFKKGQAVVLFPYVLHFSPCKMSAQGFRCAVLLSDGTNMPLAEKPSDPRLWMQNKWLYAHPSSLQALKGAYVGLVGENLEVKC
jgi:hypothetical protein